MFDLLFSQVSANVISFVALAGVLAALTYRATRSSAHRDDKHLSEHIRRGLHIG